MTTDWKYDWRDRVTNIVHKLSGGTVLASVDYVLAPGGEPTKITREDGTYVLLSYDSALRLTNEVFYTNAVAQATNSYGYDAAGTRILLATGGVTYTNAVSAGYRVTTVMQGSSTNQTYTYDSGGQITNIVRGGITNKLAYNTSGQVTNVTVGTSTNAYTHDALDRRLKAVLNGGSERRFLVAPTPDTDLESTHMIADSGNNLARGYVFEGDRPLMRYDASGKVGRWYYLEDGMGSTIGIVPQPSPTTNNTTRLFYDGFGNTRGTNGPTPTIPTGTGGDFRFHGLWLEDGTGLYYARARDYDPRTGRFLSRDPEAANVRRPESLHPYNYANANPLIYADPSGQFTVIEISAADAINKGMEALKNVVVSKIQEEAKQRVVNAFAEVAINALEGLFPGIAEFRALFRDGQFQAGIKQEELLKDAICIRLPRVARDNLWLGPAIASDGTPVQNGFGCGLRDLVQQRGTGRAGDARPDFILSPVPPRKTMRGEKAYLVGDFKLSGNSLYNQYAARGAAKKPQFLAIGNYTKKYTQLHIAVFLTVKTGDRQNLRAVSRLMANEGLKKGVLFFVISAQKNKGF